MPDHSRKRTYQIESPQGELPGRSIHHYDGETVLCPRCGRDVQVTAYRRLWKHRSGDGSAKNPYCPGSRKPLDERHA